MAPHPLANSTAEELAKLPMYYVMDLDKTMPETVAPYMPSPVEVAGCRWLTENDIDVYVTEYERTGFQGALQWYRVQVGRPDLADLQLFAGRRIDVPSMFIAGCSDWAVYLIPGAFERSAVCTRMEDCRFVKDAGHWLQQQQPEAVTDLLVDFCGGSATVAHDRCPELPFLDPRIFRKCSRVEHDGAARRCWKHQAQTGSIGGAVSWIA